MDTEGDVTKVALHVLPMWTAAMASRHSEPGYDDKAAASEAVRLAFIQAERFVAVSMTRAMIAEERANNKGKDGEG